MKYYETSRFPKFIGSAGFFSIIAVCLIALGAISWFAVSRYNENSNSPQSSLESPITQPNSKIDGVSDKEESDTKLTDNTDSQSSTIVENSVESVPYEEQEEKPQSFIVPVTGNIIKDFSNTQLQYSKTYGDMRIHTGTDIKCSAGSEVKAAFNGTVTAIEENATLGKCITIDHGNGISVKYCGFDVFSVNENEKVTTGMVIGTVGTVPSECADESHLHIEVKKEGKLVAPLTALNFE